MIGRWQRGGIPFGVRPPLVGDGTRAWLLAVALLFSALPKVGATDMFLSIPEIRGDSVDSTYRDQINIFAHTWRTTNATTFSTSARPDVGQLVLRKRVDLASPNLLLALLQGRRLTSATLVIRKPGVTPVSYLKYEMQTVVVRELSPTGNSAADAAMETLALDFDYIRETYFITSPDGQTTAGDSAYWTVSTGTGGLTVGDTTNTAPYVSAISAASTAEDTPKTITFSISDAQTTAGALVLARGSDNQTLVPTANIVIGGTGGTRTATITPAPNASGTATITISVTDGGGLTTSRSFVFTVNAVNDAPTLAPIASQVTDFGTPLEFNVSLSDIDSSVDGITLSFSSNPAGIVASGEDLTGTGATRRVRLTPALNAAGPTTMTITATDPQGARATANFAVTVNGPATIAGITLAGQSASSVVALPENTAAGTSLGKLVAIDGPGIAHTFTLSDDAGGRFVIGGAGNDELLVRAGASLDFETQPSLTVVVVAADPSNASRSRTDSFQIALSNVNEAPVVVAPTLGRVTPGIKTPLAGLLISDPDLTDGSASVQLTVTASAGTIAINFTTPISGSFSGFGTSQVVITASLRELAAAVVGGGLVYRAADTFSGAVTVSFTVNDLGGSGSGGARETTATSDFAVAHTGFTRWQASYFTASELAVAATSAPRGHGDADGVPNLVEYGLGTDPRDATRGASDLPQPLTLSIDGETFLAVRLKCRISDPGLSCTAEVATNLSNWSGSLNDTTVHSHEPIDQDFEWLTLRSKLPLRLTPNQQMRVRFDLTEPVVF